MSQRLFAWDVIVDIKDRAVKKEEDAAARCAADAAAAEHAWQQTLATRDNALQRVTGASAELVETMRHRDGFSAEAYLLHEAYRAMLVGQADTAEVTCRAAMERVSTEQLALEQARRAALRAQTSLDACRELRAKLQQAFQRAAEDEADDEAAEAAVGRKFLALRKAIAAARSVVASVRPRRGLAC